MIRYALTLLILTSMTHTACAQSLYRKLAEPQPEILTNQNPARALYGISMMVIRPPEPRLFKTHDLVTIIVNEISQATREQSIDSEKKWSANAELKRFPSLRHLLELQLVQGDSNPLAGVDSKLKNKYEADGTYERKDRLTDRLTAEIIDVKPNGVLVLEAKTTRKTDDEVQTVILSGSCRQEDITAQNTVQSSQLYNLSIDFHQEGEVKKSASKGYITKVLETVFNF